ncbi:LytTR family transcriptional regulator [Streptococcus chenjunshii]|uniref:LytTR family transcriptional regulator n=1 Tax=Streptococcus chenjunshii TaxID=2173853 RepID=A0A372KMK8_9STRE|nr:LytTR family DNA-binding domain-containing protein [Streptococcus chenjunshii]AXQ79601.1 LytTR family transcriptional regulator [Streptococcus chenjunshii]RFU51516.1 LytTR family transcriptional regulator [Streptococcus chenjunshii]RFU53503.1 LytTR family transcriptional regulator [Streptococcus chenjunshii]
MKLEIIKDLSFKETLIKMYLSRIDAKNQRIIDFIKQVSDCDYLYGSRNSSIYLVKPEQIIRFYTENKKVFFETPHSNYSSKYRLYQLEEMLPKHFIRISHSEIINLKYIKQLNLNFKGTIQVIFKTGQNSFVSRRSISNFKKALGL